MYRGRRVVKFADGTTFYMTYKELCRALGFSSDTGFVKLTTRGTIDYTCGKPREIMALKAAIERAGLVPTKNIANTVF